MDWNKIANLIAGDAPTLAGALIGNLPIPGASIIGKLAGNVLGQILGTAPTPEAVEAKIAASDPAVIAAQLSTAEAQINSDLERYKAELADKQDARKQTVSLATLGSPMQWGAAIVSFIVLCGFGTFSFLAMKPEYTTIADKSVILYLLGSWQTMAAGVVAYWIGSSVGSGDKTAQNAGLTSQLLDLVKKK